MYKYVPREQRVVAQCVSQLRVTVLSFQCVEFYAN